MKFSSTSNIAHDLEPKKMGVLLRRVNKTWYRFWLTSGYLLSGKSIMSCPNQWLLAKIDVFYWSEWIKVMNLKMNSKHFEIQKWMSQAGRAEKSRRKNGVIFVVFMFLSWLMILKLSKKKAFFKFCADLSKKHLVMLKQFTYMHLKGLVTHFQKMSLFTMLWLNVLKILVFEIEELC